MDIQIILLSSFLRIIIGLFVAMSGIVKVKMPAGKFTRVVLAYDFLPIFISNFIARVLPWIEILLGVFLIFGIWRKSTMVAVACLLCVFGLAVSVNLIQGKQNNCGCGYKDQPIHWGIPLRNIVLASVLLIGTRV